MYSVDHACIDCDLCRQIAPATFAEGDGISVVREQPATPQARSRAAMALVACPTAAIHAKVDTSAAKRAFPEQILDDVYFCGWASSASYGAASWLIRRPDGNVLVDSPRAAAPLLEQIEALGGVRTMFLTHRDDVADHEKFAARFGCERIIHAADRIAHVERLIEGPDPVALADDLRIVPVPGHTRGSAVLIYRDDIAFVGDHVWATSDGQHLEAGRGVCWYSWSEQKKSMQRLADHAFTHVIPGHGRRFTAPNAAAMRDEVLRLAAAM
ncbi:MAG: MBL fold metallo-hydrolase [Kofleriaceae bacterium]